MKTANNKISVSSVFNDSKRLYRTTVSRCLVRRPHYSARLMSFGSRASSEVFFSDTPPKYLERDCVGRRVTGTRRGNVYRSRQRKSGNCCLSATCFTNSDISLRVVLLVFRELHLLKIANINLQQEARFSLWKKLFLRESGENGV